MAGRVWLPARSLVKFPRYFMASSSPRLRLAHPKSIVAFDLQTDQLAPPT